MTTYRRLGRSGLHLFPLGLGTMQFGWSADEATSFEIMDAYVAAGGNFIDTADIYTAWAKGNPGGISEEIVGRWVKARGNRDDLVIATKVRGAMGEGFSEGRNTIHQREGLSRLRGQPAPLGGGSHRPVSGALDRQPDAHRRNAVGLFGTGEAGLRALLGLL
jgi:aryl-alcohol dehydrogenase-like predicted oxidoreductase